MSHLSKIKHTTRDWRKVKSDAIAVGIFDDLKPSRQFQGVNRELGRGLSNAMAANLIKGEVGEIRTVVGKKGTIAFVYGLGNRGDFNAETFRRAGACVSKACVANNIKSTSFLMPIDAKNDYETNLDVYLVYQITDEAGRVIHIDWSRTFAPSENTFSVYHNCNVITSGEYTVDIFVLNNLHYYTDGY